MANGYKTYDELTADQKAELRERLEREGTGGEITEGLMHEEYGETMFTDDDFSCTDGGNEDAEARKPSVRELAEALSDAQEKIRELDKCIMDMNFALWMDLEIPNYDCLLRRAGMVVKTRQTGADPSEAA